MDKQERNESSISPQFKHKNDLNFYEQVIRSTIFAAGAAIIASNAVLINMGITPIGPISAALIGAGCVFLLIGIFGKSLIRYSLENTMLPQPSAAVDDALMTNADDHPADHEAVESSSLSEQAPNWHFSDPKALNTMPAMSRSTLQYRGIDDGEQACENYHNKLIARLNALQGREERQPPHK